MSTDPELDSELSRLRSELLMGLKKKLTTETEQDMQKGSDQELERLRFEALSAKTVPKKSNGPARFSRYDRESDQEEDEDDFVLMASEKRNDDSDQEENEAPRANLDLYESNNIHRSNYETYRNECSRLMGNETYEPTEKLDGLRRLVRDKVVDQAVVYENERGPDELEYEPITRPIDIKEEMAKRRVANRPFKPRSRYRKFSPPRKLEDDEDDELHDRKRLKSVVVVKMNYATK